MKKFKTFLLIIGFIISATCFSVASFYVRENNSAVVGWINGNRVVTNDEYKDYVTETTKTAKELTEEIERLKDINKQLDSELSKVVAEKEKAEADLNTSEETINNLTQQIEALNLKIQENNETIEYLTNYINEISSLMLESIIDLPEDLKNKTLNFRYVTGTNNFYVYYNGSKLYYFDYDKGSLTQVEGITALSYLYHFNYFGHKFLGADDYLYYHDVENNTCFRVISDKVSKISADENGAYIIKSNKIYRFDFATKVSVLINESSETFSNNDATYILYDSTEELFYASANDLYYLNKTDNSCILFSNCLYSVNSATHSGGDYYEVLKYKDEFYIKCSAVVDDGYKQGLYRIDFDNLSLVQIYQSSNIDRFVFYHSFVKDYLLLLHCADGFMLYDGQTVKNLCEGTKSSFYNNDNVNPITILYETEDYFIYSGGLACDNVYKYTISTGSNEMLAESTNSVWGIKYEVDDKLVFSNTNSSGHTFLIIDKSTCTATVLMGSGTGFDIMNRFGDTLFLTSSQNSVYINKLDLSTMTVKYYYNNSASSYVGSAKNIQILRQTEETICFVSDEGYVYMYSFATDTVTGYKTDTTLNDLDNMTFYVYVNTLEDKTLYYKYVIQDDLSLERSLAIFG